MKISRLDKNNNIKCILRMMASNNRLIKMSDTDRYVFYVPALSDKFAVFLSDEGQTFEINNASQFRLSEAYKFRDNWEKANPSKGHLIIIPAYDSYPSINVIPVGHLDRLVNDYN